MNRKRETHEKYPEYQTLYDMFGIYVDWQIDTNSIIKDPHGIKIFEDFLSINTFQIVTVLHDNQEKLVIGLSLPFYNQMTYTRLCKIRTVRSTLSGRQAESMLKHFSLKLNLPILDILGYYLGR